MKNKILATLKECLGEQAYPHLWEVALFSMLDGNSKNEFVNFVRNGCLEQPMAVITVPQHVMFKKSDEDIINFITTVQKNDDQLTIVIAHADYNPANLQAVYILDCNSGEEEKCYREVADLWAECSELYFCQMEAGFVMDFINN